MSHRILEAFEPGELTCQQLAELVSDYIEGVVAPPLHEQIMAHLAGCSDCSSYVEQVRTTIVVTGEIASGEIAPPARAALLDLFRGWAASGERPTGV
jgi:predicted anti-sigma-YlaC factor YlaD